MRNLAERLHASQASWPDLRADLHDHTSALDPSALREAMSYRRDLTLDAVEDLLTDPATLWPLSSNPHLPPGAVTRIVECARNQLSARYRGGDLHDPMYIAATPEELTALADDLFAPNSVLVVPARTRVAARVRHHHLRTYLASPAATTEVRAHAATAAATHLERATDAGHAAVLAAALHTLTPDHPDLPPLPGIPEDWRDVPAAERRLPLLHTLTSGPTVTWEKRERTHRDRYAHLSPEGVAAELLSELATIGPGPAPGRERIAALVDEHTETIAAADPATQWATLDAFPGSRYAAAVLAGITDPAFYRDALHVLDDINGSPDIGPADVIAAHNAATT